MPSYDYDSGGYGRTLADLMRRRGDQAAARHLQQGDIAANLWGQAGQTIANSVAGWQRNVQANREYELESARESRRAEAEGIQIQAAKMQLGEGQRKQKGEATARALLPFARHENGVMGYDRELIQREMESAGHGDMVPQLFAQFDEQETSYLKVLEARRDTIAQDAFRVLQGGSADQETFDAMLTLWSENDLAPKVEIDALRKAAKKSGVQQALLAAASSSPRVADQIRKMQEANQPKLHNVPEGSTVINERTGETMFQGQPKTPTNLEQAILQATDPAERAELIGLKEQFSRAGRAPDVDRRAPVSVIGPDGKPVYVRPDQAVGMQPASAREQTSGADIPPQLRNALDRATINLTATKRAPLMQLASRLAAEGNEDGLKDIIRQAAIETENVDTKNQILGRQATLASLKDTRSILNEMKAKGIPTGWLTGTAEDVARRVGKSTDTEYVELANRLMGTLINYRRAATGVAFSAREQADYARMFPNYKNDLPVNMALIDGLEREMHTYDAEYWTHKLGKDGAALVGVIPGAKKDGATDQAGSGWTDVGGFKVRVKQ